MNFGVVWGPNWLPNWAHFGAKLGPKSDQKCIANFILISISFWFDLGMDFAPTWPQNPPKMEPSWLQNRSNLECSFERCFLMDVGPFFMDSLPQHGMAEVAKIANSFTFFIVFHFLLLCCLHDLLRNVLLIFD